jgi:hypothetical protein
MKHFRALLLAAALVTSIALVMRAAADEIHDGGGESDTMKQMGTHMHPGPHMLMTDMRPVTPEDSKRAREFLEAMRAALTKYQDYKIAIADGYQPFFPTVPQDMYHFSNRSITASEYMGSFDVTKPGSLLYRKKFLTGYDLIGAMYSAPEDASPSQLDEMIPLSLGRWHAHTNICLPKGVTMQDVVNSNVKAGAHSAGMVDPDPERKGGGMVHYSGRSSSVKLRGGFMVNPKFGFEGDVSNAEQCGSAGGQFHKQLFGWMIHVYPFAGDDFKVAFSNDAP